MSQHQLQPEDFKEVQFKLILIGDGGVGKTTYITRVKDGNFLKNYVATVGADVQTISFYTNCMHKIIFEVWDTAGQEINSMLSDVYYVDAKAAIVMFDVTSRATFKNVPRWLMKLRTLTTLNNVNIPTIVCGNKVDLKDRKINASSLKAGFTRNITNYFDISARGNFNFDKPFLELAKVLLRNNDLQFVANFNLKPSEINVEPQEAMQSEEIMRSIDAAKNASIGDDDLL